LSRQMEAFESLLGEIIQFLPLDAQNLYQKYLINQGQHKQHVPQQEDPQQSQQNQQQNDQE